MLPTLVTKPRSGHSACSSAADDFWEESRELSKRKGKPMNKVSGSTQKSSTRSRAGAAGALSIFVALAHGACASEIDDERGSAESVGEVALELGATNTVGTITSGDFGVSYDANSAYFTYFGGEFCFGGLEIEKMSLS